MHLVLNIFDLSEVVLFSLFNICLCLLSLYFWDFHLAPSFVMAFDVSF